MKRVLMVGLCNADARKMVPALKERFDVEVENYQSRAEGEKALERGDWDVVFINRLSHKDRKIGFDLIPRAKDMGCSVVLLSRFSEMRQKALQMGADLAFDMDMLIGYVTPRKESERENLLRDLKKLLD